MSGAYGPWPTVPMTNGAKPHYPAWVKAYERRRALRLTAFGLVCLLCGLLAGALLGGCATLGSTTPRAGQEQAVHIVWVESYGRKDRPPLVRWVEGAALDCTDPQSGKRGFTIIDVDTSTGEGPVRCREGFTWGPLEVLVAWHGETSYAETPLAHELLHALLLRQGVVFERHHARPDFYPRIDMANAALIQAGR